MDKAKEMVSLSVHITEKLKSQLKPNADEEEDEEVKKFKSCLLSMGIIDNPVTKDSSGSKYYKDLAVEINRNFESVVRENGGIMSLTDLYCRLNRARAMAGLISPEDLLNACAQLKKLNLKLGYYFHKESNLRVVQIDEMIEDIDKLNAIYDLMEKNKCLSVDQLSKLLKCNTLVARQQLLYGETIGKFCRDDTMNGLFFYTNLLLQQ